jgi:hypothetical protein
MDLLESECRQSVVVDLLSDFPCRYFVIKGKVSIMRKRTQLATVTVRCH